MPIIIRELAIKVAVDEQSSAGSATTQSTEKVDPQLKKEMLLQACIDQVSQILKNKNER